jgi:hypothetical protein
VRFRWVILFLALLLLGLYAALPALSGLPALRTWVARRIEQATASEIRFASLRVNYDLSVTLSGVSVAQPGRAPYLTAEGMQVVVRPLALFSGQPLRVRIEEPHLHVAELPARSSAGGGAPVIPLEHAEVVDLFVHPLAGEGSTVIGPLSLDVNSVEAGPGQLSLSGSGPLPGSTGTVSWSAEVGPSFEASHGSFSVEAPSLVDAVRPWFALALPPAVSPRATALRLDWRGTASGRIAIDLAIGWELPVGERRMELAGSGEIDPNDGAARLQLTGTQMGLRSPDATRAANGIETRTEMLARRATDGGLHLEFKLAVPAGEVLWDRFYVDLRRHPLTVRGKVDTSATQLTLADGAVEIGGIGTVNGSGSYDVDRAQDVWRVQFKVPGLAAAYAVGVREPLQDAYPLLGRLELNGRASGTIEQERVGEGTRRLKGVVDLDGVTINTSDPRVAVRALDLHLPIDLSETNSGSGAAQSGVLRMRDLDIADIAVGDLALPLRVENNQIAVAEPVRIPLMGGALEIAHLRAVDLTGAPNASLGLAIHDLDLAAAAQALGLPRLKGRVVGQIPALTVAARSVQSEGEIRMDVFGGSVLLRNLRVEEPFSPVPTLHLDLDIADILLAELTGTFEIGHISGVVAGGARDLEIANGEPARFDAWMETVPRSGVPQRISVTAIRQLSILGGAGGDPISFGVLGFFDEYRYAKMGFRCRLENDRFTLEGIEKHGDAEYLVVGTTLPPRVNVISHTRVIAFSELVERLSRVLAIRPESAPPSGAGAEAEPTPTPG